MKVYVYLEGSEKAFFEQAAREHGLSLSSFFRQAAMEKALGRPMDKGTSELLVEIGELKRMIAKRKELKHETLAVLNHAARVDLAGIPEAELRARVIELLQHSPPLNLHDIARALRLAEKFIMVVLARMLEDGVITIDDNMEYTMTR